VNGLVSQVSRDFGADGEGGKGNGEAWTTGCTAWMDRQWTGSGPCLEAGRPAPRRQGTTPLGLAPKQGTAAPPSTSQVRYLERGTQLAARRAENYRRLTVLPQPLRGTCLLYPAYPSPDCA
jgi:hypothetical protein